MTKVLPQRPLEEYAEDIRERLIELDAVSQANLLNIKPYQIDVEIDEENITQVWFNPFSNRQYSPTRERRTPEWSA